jgi:hypothetical protein
MKTNDVHYQQNSGEAAANNRIARLNFEPVQVEPRERAKEERILSFGRTLFPKILKEQKSFALAAYGLPGSIELCTDGVAYSQNGWLEVAGLTVLNMDDVRRFIKGFHEQPLISLSDAKKLLQGIKQLGNARKWVRIRDDYMAIHHQAGYDVRMEPGRSTYSNLISGIAIKAVQLTEDPQDKTYTRGLALDMARNYR